MSDIKKEPEELEIPVDDESNYLKSDRRTISFTYATGKALDRLAEDSERLQSYIVRCLVRELAAAVPEGQAVDAKRIKVIIGPPV